MPKPSMIALLALLFLGTLSAQEVLRNDSILKLVRSGLSEETIVSIVKTQPGKYSLSAEDVISLKNAGVSEKIISALLAKGSAARAQEAAPTGAKGARFKKIYIGEAVSSLPFPCTNSVDFCEGPYESVWVRTWVSDGKVGPSFSVIYADREIHSVKLDKQGVAIHGKFIADPLPTLGQAVKIHSLQPAFGPPRFAYGREDHAAKYGIVDLTNRIAYVIDDPDSAGPESQVQRVSYLEETAQELSPAEGDLLSNEDNAELLEAAQKMPPYAPTQMKFVDEEEAYKAAQNIGPRTSVQAKSVDDKEYRAATPAEAADRIARQNNVIIGKGKLVLSLIERLQIWYEIDKDHPKAQADAEELRRAFPEYMSALETASKLYTANKKFEHKDRQRYLMNLPVDELDEATALMKEIDSQKTRLEAMGFDF